ncbi:hypothetical protein [Plantactinospora veratri]
MLRARVDPEMLIVTPRLLRRSELDPYARSRAPSADYGNGHPEGRSGTGQTFQIVAVIHGGRWRVLGMSGPHRPLRDAVAGTYATWS